MSSLWDDPIANTLEPIKQEEKVEKNLWKQIHRVSMINKRMLG